MKSVDNVLFSREISGGHVLEVLPLNYGVARLGIRKKDSLFYDDVW